MDVTLFNLFYQSPLKERQVVSNHLLCLEEGMCHPALSSDNEGGKGWVQSDHLESVLLASLQNNQLHLLNLLTYFSCPGSEPHGWENLFQLALFLKVSIML